MELHKISRRSFLEATALSGAAAVFSHPLSGGLVSTASASFKSMATTFEKALDEVDKRSSPEGVKPVVATDLETLVKTNGVQGQSGIVTNAGSRRVSTTCSATARVPGRGASETPMVREFHPIGRPATDQPQRRHRTDHHQEIG